MTNRSKKTALFTLTHTVNGRTRSAALTTADITRLVGVNAKTARRWIDGTQCPSDQTLELLRIKAFGILPDPAFAGFYAEDGYLTTPDGGQLDKRDLIACIWLRGIYYRGIRDNESRQEELDNILKLLPQIDLIRRKKRV